MPPSASLQDGITNSGLISLSGSVAAAGALLEVFSTFFFFNDTATTEIYTLSLHDALPISAFGDTFVGGITNSGLVSLTGHGTAQGLVLETISIFSGNIVNSEIIRAHV